jgi:hypothetical protein
MRLLSTEKVANKVQRMSLSRISESLILNWYVASHLHTLYRPGRIETIRNEHVRQQLFVVIQSNVIAVCFSSASLERLWGL